MPYLHFQDKEMRIHELQRCLAAGEPIALSHLALEEERKNSGSWIRDALLSGKPVWIVHGVIDALDLRDQIIHGALTLVHCQIESFDFAEARFERSLRIPHSEIAGTCRGDGVRIEGGIFAQNAHFQGEFRLIYAQITGQAVFNGAKFGSLKEPANASFLESEIGGGLHLLPSEEEPCSFYGKALFDGAEIRGGLFAEQVRFYGEARFVSTQVENQLVFDGAEFHGAAIFTGASIGTELILASSELSKNEKRQNCTFHGPASFARVQVGGGLFAERVEFLDEARFLGARITDQVVFNGAQFRGFAIFQGATVGAELILSTTTAPDDSAGSGSPQTTFHSLAAFDRMQVAGGLIADGCLFKGMLTMMDSEIAGGLHIRRAEFLKGASFVRSHIKGPLFADRARFRGMTSLADARIDGVATFPSAIFRGVCDMHGIIVEGALAMAKTDLSKAPLFTLERARIGVLDLPRALQPRPTTSRRVVWTILRLVHFQGARRAIHLSRLLRIRNQVILDACDHQRLLGVKPELFKVLCATPKRGRGPKRPDEEVFSAIESSLRRQGEGELADEAHYQGRRFRYSWKSWLYISRLPRTMADFSFWLFAGYGMRAWVSTLWLAVLVGLSLFVWSSPGAVVDPKLFAAGPPFVTLHWPDNLWFSLETATPLTLLKAWEPNPDVHSGLWRLTFTAWFGILRIFGVLIVGFFLGTITGFFRYVRRF